MTKQGLAAEGFEWSLTVIGVGGGRNADRQGYRLRVRTARGEKATDLTPAELPARIAELCERLGLEGITMDDEIDLSTLAAKKREKLTQLDEEIAALVERRKHVAREVKAIERCADMLAESPRPGRKPRGLSAAGETTPRRAAKDDGPSLSERVVADLEEHPNATTAEIAERLGLPIKTQVAIVCSHLERKGLARRIGDGFRLAKKPAKAA